MSVRIFHFVLFSCVFDFRPLDHLYTSKMNPPMSMTNNSLITTTTTTFARNSSCPTSIHSNQQSTGFNGRRCFSSATLPPVTSDEFDLKNKSVNCQTLGRDMQLNDNANISWFDRCKQRVTNIFKQISKPTSREGK